MRKTKIIASLGPNSQDYNDIFQMINLGVDVFRINLSHTKFQECDLLIENIQKASLDLKKIIGIMLDITGPSIRIDELKEKEVYLSVDKEIRVYNYHVVCNNTQISTNYSNIVELVKLNDELIIGNSSVYLKVININDDNFVCQVIKPGIIKSRQVVHLKNKLLKRPYLSKEDKDNILYAIKKKVDYLGLSYVRDEQDVLAVVDMLIENDNDSISLISKIENEEAFVNLESILKVSDGVMVARGDLSIESAFEKLPYYQKSILKMANDYQKIGLVATDLLSNMVSNQTPARSDITDIYNAVYDKCDGLVLCDETTIGKYPLRCVDVLEKVILEAENHFTYKENLDNTFRLGKQDVTSTIAYSVVDAGILLNAKCILANTMSGYTARKISYFRPKSIILGLSPNINTARSLTLNYGVLPVVVKKFTDTDEIIKECINKYKELIPYDNGDIVIITGGLPLSNKNTDFMKIEKIVD